MDHEPKEGWLVMLSLPPRIAILVCAFTTIASPPVRAAALYNATPLTATNDFQPIVEGLDNRGQVLLWNMFAPAGSPAYSIYNSQDGTITSLVANDSASLNTQFIPQHISGNGQMVGWIGGTPILSSDGQITKLPAGAAGVNDSGQVAVTYNPFNNGTTSSIVTNGKATPIGIAQGYDSTVISAINNAGQAAATATLNLHGGGTYLSQPVFYDGQHIIPLGTFGGQTGFAVGINNKGDVVGMATDATQSEIGFVSHNGGPLIPLLGPGNQNVSASPTSINDSGQIVGKLMDGSNRAFIYQDGILTDLNKMLLPSVNLKVTDAFFINNAGQIVVEGYYDGAKWPQVLLLTPEGQPIPNSPDPLVQMAPEPSTLAVFGLMFAGVIAYRRQQAA